VEPNVDNMLLLRIVSVTTPEGKRRLVIYKQAGNVEKTISGPVDAVLAVDDRFHNNFRSCCRSVLECARRWGTTTLLREGIRDFSGAMQASCFIIAVRTVGMAAGAMGAFDQTVAW